MKQITRISPCIFTKYDDKNNPLYGYKEEIIVGADATRFRNGAADLSCLMGFNTETGEGAVTGQVIVGQYNEVKDNSVFIIGNGSSETNRSNIVEVTEATFLIKRDLNVEGDTALNHLIVNGNANMKGNLEAANLKVNNDLTVIGTIKGTMQNKSGISYATTAEVKAINNLDNYYTKTTIDSTLSNYLTTTAWKSKVTGSSNWNWTGQSGQPTWLWGGNDVKNFYVYNPANFSVARAKVADVATEARSLKIIDSSGQSIVSIREPADYYGVEIYSYGDIILNPGGGAGENCVYLYNTYGHQLQGGRTLKIDKDGMVYTPTSSSKRFKEHIENISNSQLNPHLLYKIPVKQYYYKDKNIEGLKIGLIAEDVAEIYPVAAIYDEIGPENWDERYIIPPMLKLIQEQHEAIENLKEEIQKLKGNS